MKQRTNNKLILLCVSLTISFLIGGIIFWGCGYSPVSAYAAILKGGLGNKSAFINSLSQAMPIAFMGLAYIVASKAGIINIGLEGQMYAGAMAAAIAGVCFSHLPRVLHLLAVFLFTIITSGTWGMLIAGLKIKFGANEVITAIMLNFIMENFTSYLANGPLKSPGTVAQTERVLESAKLWNLIETPQLSSGILIVLFITILMFIFMRNTRIGYEMRVIGQNYDAARTAGIPVSQRLVQVMFMSGAIAGLAGAVMVVGVNGRFVEGFSSGYGWDGVAVASLAGLSIFGNLLSALLFGVLRAGASMVNRTARIPYDFILVIQAVMILMLACPRLTETLVQAMGRVLNRRERRKHGVME